VTSATSVGNRGKHSLVGSCTDRATIVLEPKISKTGENSIFLPKINQHLVKLFLFARLTSDIIFAHSSPGAICFSNILFLEKKTRASRIPFCNRQGKRFFLLAYFLIQLARCSPSVQN